ncbi:MAG: hypothetical protein RLZZ450_1592 [Pseudomonadota bacterium]|jgi:hypothetical protein
MAPTKPTQRLSSVAVALTRDQRGGVSTEYLILTGIGLVVAVGLGVLGAALVPAYGSTLQTLYADSP